MLTRSAGRRVVVVDAVVGGGPPGRAHRLHAAELATGLGAPLVVRTASAVGRRRIELARTLYGDDVRIAIVGIVGISVARPTRAAFQLSPAVRAAVAPAAALAEELARVPR